jgi:hypothetical protein
METNERIPFEHPKFKAFEARYQQIFEKLARMMAGKEWLEGKI